MDLSANMYGAYSATWATGRSSTLAGGGQARMHSLRTHPTTFVTDGLGLNIEMVSP